LKPHRDQLGEAVLIAFAGLALAAAVATMDELRIGTNSIRTQLATCRQGLTAGHTLELWCTQIPDRRTRDNKFL
jgi:hypothetical protein